MLDLSIIILQHNTPDHVERNLRALKAAELPQKTEIIIVDNGGKGANVKIPQDAWQGLDVQFFETPNDGFPKGNNFGLSKAREAKFYAFVNPDIIVRKDTVKILLDHLRENPKVGLVAPQLIYPDGTIQDSYRTFPRLPDLFIKRIAWLRRSFPERMRSYLMWDKDPEVTEPIDWAVGAFVIVTKEVMDKLEKHDDRYFLFMSDVVICRDVWEQGYEVHYVAQAKATHNDKRVSDGTPVDFFKKKIIRIHVTDALRYFTHYFFKRLPEEAPSVDRLAKKQRVLHAHKLSKRPHVVQTQGRLQEQNPVVHVYEAAVDGPLQYQQPIVYFDTGVVGVITNQAGEIGLIKIWRHTPLRFQKKNTFPVFPDVGDMGIWSWECPRGGVEKEDTDPVEGLRRELEEELGLHADKIVGIEEVSKIIGNTALDVYHHRCYKVVVKDDFTFDPESDVEAIEAFKFYNREELQALIVSGEFVCGISQAAVLQVLGLAD